MAIAIDQANAGVAANDAAGSSIAVTSNQPIAAGSLIVASLSLWHATATFNAPTSTGTVLTWTVIVQGKHASSNPRAGLAVAYTPGAISSGGITVTSNLSASSNARGIGLSSFTGVDSTTPTGATSGPTTAVASTAWASASTAIGNGSALIAVTSVEDSGSSTITSPSLETVDANGGVGTFTIAGGYRIETTAASYTVAGTTTVTANNVVVAAELLPATAAPSVSNAPELLRVVRSNLFLG